jgi:hypothetical protein
MRKRILEMRIYDALEYFDAYFDDIEQPDNYYVEFGRWIEEKLNDS